MKKQSTTLKKTTEVTDLKTFWSKEWRDLSSKQKKAEDELENCIKALDQDPEIQALLGRDFGAIEHERKKLLKVTATNESKCWSEVSRFKSLTAELARGKVKRSKEELFGMIDDIFGAMDGMKMEIEKSMREHVEDSKDVMALEKDLRDGDKVKGFDLEEIIDVDLIIDLKKFEDIMDEQEEAMINNYHAGCEMLKEKRDLEIQVVEQSDLQDPFKFVSIDDDNFRETYNHLYKLCEKENKPREYLFKLVQTIYPSLTRENQEMLFSYCVHSKYQHQRKQAINRCFQREKLDLKRKAEDLIHENLAQKLSKMQKNKEMEEQDKKVKVLKAELEVRKKEYDKVQREIEKKQRLKEEQEKRELELQKAKFEQHAQVVKKMAEQYKVQRQQEYKAVQQEREQKLLAEKKALKEKIEAKAPDVNKRMEKAENALIQKLEDKKARETSEENRLERIKQAIERYTFRPQVERDYHRMTGDTVSVNIRKETKEHKPIFSNPGFYDDKLMGDVRFKLQTRLFEAGVQNSEYARNLMNQLSKPGGQLPNPSN